jgi:hypothetical protein|tara:strand:- start:8888 stop:9175 length:288 start_codon:yes stop_codon:yes gene_type:complete
MNLKEYYKNRLNELMEQQARLPSLEKDTGDRSYDSIENIRAGAEFGANTQANSDDKKIKVYTGGLVQKPLTPQYGTPNAKARNKSSGNPKFTPGL